jgi:glycosyltransferase involved in cell wall biosynthesis
MLLENNPYPQDGRVRGEATALTAAGYRVTIVCPAAQGQRWRERLDGVGIYRFPAPPKADSPFGYMLEYAYAMSAAFILSLIALVSEGFDVVHAHNPPDTFFVLGAFYKLLGKRFVFDHHDLSPEMYDARFDGRRRPLVRTLLLLCEWFSCRLADRVIATNHSYKVVEMDRGRVPEERITVVRNGPTLETFQPGEPLTDLKRDGRTIIGYAGVMGRQDGVEYLLRALGHLRADLGRSNFLCVLVGAGDGFADLQRLALDLGLGNHVWFAGWRGHDEVAHFLTAADICVAPEPSNPYTDRSTMIKLMEYMACQKPIVAFDLPEHRVTAQQAAIYVRPNDELEFARAVAVLIDDPERRLAMGSFGRGRVENELAWGYSVVHLLEAYRSLLSGARKTTLRNSELGIEN